MKHLEKLNDKICNLHNILQHENRKTLIVGVSGGIDSAVVLGLLRKLDDTYPDTYKVIPVIAPINNSSGTTGQQEATRLGHEVCSTFGYTPVVFDLEELSKVSSKVLDLETGYLKQQNDYWLRPMAFYSVAMKHENSILVSTTNYSEWITGWFSQYLDIFGIHPIIDYFKSEVFSIGEHLNVPTEVLNAVPKGGLASGRTDEQELGFTYESLESYLNSDSKVLSDTLLVQRIGNRIEESKFKRARFDLDFIFKAEVIL